MERNFVSKTIGIRSKLSPSLFLGVHIPHYRCGMCMPSIFNECKLLKTVEWRTFLYIYT